MTALQLRSDGISWWTFYAVVGLLMGRLVFGAWPWQGDESRHGKRYYLGLAGLWVVGWIAVIAF